MTRSRGNSRIADLVGFFVILGIFLLVSVVTGCATTDESMTPETDAAGDMSADSVQSSTTTEGGQSGGAFRDESMPDAANGAASEQSLEDIPETVASPRVVESCKKEPYTKYEASARGSIKTGWEATKAERYGVGFRDAAEYKKWSATHNALFKRVTAACASLSKCALASKKDKKKQCVAEATAFRDLQNLAKTFASNAKEVENSQVVNLCSMKPDLEDPARCFDALATNIRVSCKSEECGELAQCWQNIYFMDAALRQAESSCQFARQKLSQCRGYSEQIGRRKEQLARCAKMHEAANIKVLPVL